MQIPRAWAKVSADGRFPDGKAGPVSVWGWGEDDASARRSGAERLQRVLERIRRGEPLPDRYGYGSRPLREEILETIQSGTAGEACAIVTRNSYGVRVLNAGLRAMAIDREFDPTAREVQDLMLATGTDPAYARLCMVQRSFRARLTPKPWRCGSLRPPGRYALLDGELQRRFAAWLGEYDRASKRYATCRYLETIGNGSPRGDTERLIELHDRETRCDEALPLA